MDQITGIKNKINREYFEYYAKYSLIMSLSQKYTYLNKGESPDWQSDRLNIGVEVTRAIDKDIYLAYNIINEYFGNVFVSNHISEKILKLKDQYKKTAKANGETPKDYIDILNIDNLQKRYLHKTIKLNRNYIQYNENQLYMFTFKSMDENEVKKCFDVDLSKYKVNFDVCFVNCFDKLYVCDFVRNTIICSIDLDTKTLDAIKKKALKKSNL